MSNKSAVPIAASKTLRYEQDAGLPVAIEARSNRRTFYPFNGEVFAPDGTNVIRMTLNSNSFVDFAHSYLQFKVTNKTLADGGGNALHVAPDFGLPFFNRLQIMSGGTELEDIQEWSRLYATLQGVQGSIMNDNDIELTHNRRPSDTLPDENDVRDDVLQGEAADKMLKDFVAALATSEEVVVIREEVHAFCAQFPMPGLVPEGCTSAPAERTA